MERRKKRTRWTPLLIEKRLEHHAKRVGRMPSANELRRSGDNALACAVSRGGGFLWWARRLGLEQKGTETHRGQRWERHEELYLRSLGFSVEAQTTKAPFDLMVNGYMVDVKSASFGRYKNRARGDWVAGYVFAGLRRGVDCDFFDLVCVDGHRVDHRYIVPSDAAKIHTLTITAKTINGAGKYSLYSGATEQLEG